MKNEQEILNSILWPQNKRSLTGDLIYSNSIDLTTTASIEIYRTNKKIEISYSSYTSLSPNEKVVFMKLCLNKEGDKISIDFKKSSPQLKTEEDLEDTLNTIRSAIIKINAFPTFFPSGVVDL